LLIVNYNELNQKDQRKKKEKKATIACCHHLFHSITTIEKGDGITTVTLFVPKPPKKATDIEKGDGSYHHFLLLLKHREKGDGSKLLSTFLLQHHHR
jgi:hypothetical protein